MAQYTYIAADLMTGAALAELPLDQVSFERKLNGAGMLTARLPLGDRRVAQIDPFTATQPQRTALYVDRDGVLVWGGIIWTRTYDSQSATLQIQGQEFWSYFARRVIPVTLTYAGVDQAAIVYDILSWILRVAYGNPRITLPAVSTTGVLRSATYLDYQLSTVEQVIGGLAALEQGFDFAVDVAYSGGAPAQTFTLSYPRRGATAFNSGYMFELPGNIVSYTWPEDGSKGGTVGYALGAGNAGAMLRSSAANAALLTAGYPLLEFAQSYKTETVQANLDARIRSDVDVLSAPVVTPSVVVAAGQDPVLGSYTVGDEARFRISDQRFPAPQTGGGAGLDMPYRIIGMVVTPPTANQDEFVALTLGPAVA